ncbi:unnamed protein product [Linum trigynum]|uniref:Uncharacterized protein n=1 Tax=Linum trigynum TaxID=586398 RepID=A0AAV2GSN5_9ROSI
MSNKDKPQQQKQGKEIVTVKDITTNKYDTIVTTLESLMESTERAAAASRDSTGALEALGGRITPSIEEMGKTVTEKMCQALADTMKEVLIGVMQGHEPNPENRPAAVKMMAEAVFGAAAKPETSPPGAAAGEGDGAVADAAGGEEGGSAGASTVAASDASAAARSQGATTGQGATAPGNVACGGAGGGCEAARAGGTRRWPILWAEGGRGSGQRRTGRASLKWAGPASCSNGPRDCGGPRKEEGGRV